MEKLEKKYCAFVNDMVGERGWVKRMPEPGVKRAVALAEAAITGRWPGTPICNSNAGADLRAAAAALIEEAERVEAYNKRAA